MTRKFFLFIALTALALSGAAQAQQIYRWVDANGKIHYTAEKPPPGARSAAPVESRVSAVGRNDAPGQSAAPKAAGAATRAQVTMFATSWCPYCRHAREYFAANNIPYTELDVEKSEEAKQRYRALGGKGVPVILVGEQRMNGFSEQRLAQMLKASGY